MTTKPHPKTVRTLETIKKVKSLILEENPPTQRFIASKLGTPSNTVCKIIQDIPLKTNDTLAERKRKEHLRIYVIGLCFASVILSLVLCILAFRVFHQHHARTCDSIAIRVPPCRKGTVHLQTSMLSTGSEVMVVSVTNHYTGWATSKPNINGCGSCQNQKPEQPPLLEITAATRLGIDSKRLWMCSWGTADQAASTRCQS
ncbi:hypothetical protein TNCV_2737101 [Trichonephila clavipes]|nr:hypothetical protein TNCV_2737101 [Trichonephila clavipes]